MTKYTYPVITAGSGSNSDREICVGTGLSAARLGSIVLEGIGVPFLQGKRKTSLNSMHSSFTFVPRGLSLAGSTS